MIGIEWRDEKRIWVQIWIRVMMLRYTNALSGYSLVMFIRVLVSQL